MNREQQRFQAADAVDLPRLVEQGWRFFHCEDCEHRWKAATRDWRSFSGDNCPRCGEWWFPYHGEADNSLPVDKMGNLLPDTQAQTPRRSREAAKVAFIVQPEEVKEGE